MPKGVEHIEAPSITFMKGEVKESVMPKGVEHCPLLRSHALRSLLMNLRCRKAAVRLLGLENKYFLKPMKSLQIE